jgi:Amt family ammonium transporter
MRFDFNTLDPGATAWVLTSAALVLLMTPALAFFYGGLVRSKHVLAMMMQCFMAVGLVAITWVLVGYSMAFGSDNGLFGGFHFLGLANMDEVVPGFIDDKAMSIPPIAFATFQMMFAIITVALITGSTADRWRLASFVPFVIAWVILVYGPVAHWVFSPFGWAENLTIGPHQGALDFAGGTVVHANAGAAGLAMAMVLGPRRGWPGDDIRPHNMPFVLLGTALLWFGWLGFNAGSALKPDNVASFAFLNTNIAAGMSMLVWALLERIKVGRATTLGAASGAVAGLVAITPCAGFVTPLGAAAIGALAAIGCGLSVLSRSRRWDDSLDVVGLHLVGGVIGSLGLGLFASTSVNEAGADGLIYGGGVEQLVLQFVTVLAVVAYSFAVTFGLGLLLGRGAHNRGRVRASDEDLGLDLSQHGEEAYRL